MKIDRLKEGFWFRERIEALDAVAKSGTFIRELTRNYLMISAGEGYELIPKACADIKTNSMGEITEIIMRTGRGKYTGLDINREKVDIEDDEAIELVYGCLKGYTDMTLDEFMRYKDNADELPKIPVERMNDSGWVEYKAEQREKDLYELGENGDSEFMQGFYEGIKIATQSLADVIEEPGTHVYDVETGRHWITE